MTSRRFEGFERELAEDASGSIADYKDRLYKPGC